MTEVIKLSRLSHFRVTCADGSSVTDQLYANGRHQCELVVEIIKECQNTFGEWESVEFTDEEVASVSIAQLSSEDGQRLPSGWRCDEEKNSCSKGLWGQEERNERAPDSDTPGARVQRVSRYLRFHAQGAMDAVTFTAHMVLDGQVHVTQSLAKDSHFNSSVTIQPVASLRLSVKDLVEFRHEAVSQDGFRATVYYWTPPAGLVFVAQQGLDRPLDMPYEGNNFQTSYAYVKQGNGAPHKIGVVANSNPVVMLRDIFQPYGYPLYNYYVRTDMRPTIMRAIKVQSPYLKIDLSRDSESTWRLIDNYGSQHTFRLVRDGEYGVSLRDVVTVPGRVNVSVFNVFLSGDQVRTNELYANDRHQCKVIAEVVKEEEQPDGTWKAVGLTDTEQDSLTITLYSGDNQVQLPAGWSCDKQKNMFDTGLWHQSAQAPHVEDDEHSDIVDSSINVFDRYMRFSSGYPIESQRFMARIVVGGKIYTTQAYPGNASVTITPVRPYVLRARDLRQYVHEPYFNSQTTTDIDVFYWLPPAGLQFLANRGLDAPLPISNEGNRFQTSFGVSRSALKHSAKFGVVTNSDQVGVEIRLRDIHRGLLEDGSNPVIKINQYNTIMRAVRLASHAVGMTVGDRRTPWRLWDNFGCEHVFMLYTEDNGHSIKLGDIN